jgi:hypothetical protein
MLEQILLMYMKIFEETLVESFFRPWTRCKGEKESSWTNSLREIVENANLCKGVLLYRREEGL